MKKFIVSGLVAGCLLSSTLTLADTSGTGKFMRFFDTNKDGVVTLAEFEAVMNTRFRNMDSDHDGLVSKAEFRNYLQHRRLEHRQARLKRMDSNGDGQVSKAEYLAYQAKKAEARFARQDKNHDGVLRADELQMHGSRFVHHGGHNLFGKLDANGDGVISLEESRVAASAWFTRLDTNGDNIISAEEVKAFHDHRFAHKVSR